MPARTPSSAAFCSSSAAHALFSASPILLARFWMAPHRARSGTKNWCSSGSVHATVLGHAVGDQLLRLLLEPVREPFQEEQAEDVGLVVAAVDRPAQDVGRGPEVLLELGDAQRLSRWVGSLDHRLGGCRWRTQ